MAGLKRRICSDSDIHAIHKELDEVSCPICMDHPHNAVLLICSSHEKGCRTYICDTSYRHSNCLDRYKKLGINSDNCSTPPHSASTNTQYSSDTSDVDLDLRIGLVEGDDSDNMNESGTIALHQLPERSVANIEDQNGHLDSEGEGILELGGAEFYQEGRELNQLDAEDSMNSKSSLKCPLCRGEIIGWKVVEDARKYLNLKKRSCSRESCSFSGNYQELRRHARRVHPATRPSDIDPSRERAWRRLEHQREYGDVVSAIRSAMPGAVVIGDYVIENGERFTSERGSNVGETGSPWRTTFFLFQMIGSLDSGEARARSRPWPRHRRAAGTSSERRYLWGENLLDLQDEADGDYVQYLNSLGEDGSPIPRRRRRIMRSRSDED